ncbi:MAG: class I SAM-dependent methyltransferase [Acetanaerobacterium sp.]
MEYPVLDKRLGTAAGWVRAGSVLADVGTDHGYLAANLVGRGVCPAAYACDVGTLPLLRARDTVVRCGLSDKIRLVLSDGLTGLEPHCAQDIVIAGMGGELIARILTGVQWICDKGVRLILQPMTRAEHLRRHLFTNGFDIEGERGVCEGTHCYTVICAYYTGTRNANPDELAVSLGGLCEGADEDSQEYIRRLIMVNYRRAQGLARSASPQKQALAQQALAFVRRLEQVSGIVLDE